MAVTLTWYEVSGASPTKTPLTVASTLNYGSVQAGVWNYPVKCVVATVAGGDISSVRFWWKNTNATTHVGSENMKPVAPAVAWNHTYRVPKLVTPFTNTYANPTSFPAPTESVHSYADWPEVPYGDNPDALLPAPGLAIDFSNVTDGNDTDYIYFGIQPPDNATDGDWTGFYYRCSFLYA